MAAPGRLPDSPCEPPTGMPQLTSGERAAPLRVVHVARECSGIVSEGGVGDVVLQLAAASVREGIGTTIVLPHYGSFSQDGLRDIAERLRSRLRLYRHEPQFPRPCSFDVPMGYAHHTGRTESATIRCIRFNGAATLTVAFVVADRFAGKERPYSYTAAEARAILEASPEDKAVCGAEPPPRHFDVAEGSGHFDYFAMNVLLQKAALLWLARNPEPGIAVHCHDAHTAMLPMMAKLGEPESACADYRYVVTAHNCGAAYRQRCAHLDYVAAVSGLPLAAIQQCVIDGEFDPFAAAALYADHLTTVSDGYAWEVQGAWLEASGGDSDLRGFSRFLASQSVPIKGIVNGIAADIKGPEAIRGELGKGVRHVDDFSWKPAFRKRFVQRISRRELLPRWGISGGDRHGSLKAMPDTGCLFTFVGRWTYQKGVGIIARAAQEVLSHHRDTGLCVLGAGNQPFVYTALLDLVEEFPGRVVIVKGFSESLAASIYAAGDFFLAPSRFEPCGLIDMIAQLNGNIPVVNQVGGLSKVIDGVTGIGYFATNDRNNLRGLVRSMHRAIDLLRNPTERARIQFAGNREVRTKYAWKSVLARYIQLYGSGSRVGKRTSPLAPTGQVSPTNIS